VRAKTASWRLDRFELAVLIVLAGTSMLVLAGLLTRGRPLSGADGVFAVDQLQYLAWIRDASENWLIGNYFGPGDHVFLHPGFLLSGLVHKITGLSVPVSYLLWKPVAVGLMFAATLAYVRRQIEVRNQQRVAIVLILFAVMPASALVAWSNWGGNPRQFTFDFISGEMWSGQYLWGYLMTGIAVFLMPLVLLGFERWRERGGAGRLALVSLGLFIVMWLQPWQGATLMLILVVVEGWRLYRDREAGPAIGAAIACTAGAIPAVYYFVLSKVDEAWEMAGEANAAGAQTEWSWPWWAILLTVAPLAIPAALAYRLPMRSWQDLAMRVWPFAALAVYLLPVGTFPYHSFQGLVIPLSVLAVMGIASRWKPPAWAVIAALLFMVVPGFAHKLEVARHSVHRAGAPYYVFPDEVEAMKVLEADERDGLVLSPTYDGYMLPYRTGRDVYIGAFSWTPDWEERQKPTDDLFEGRLTGEAARDFVRSTGARFVFSDCRPDLISHAELKSLLGDMVEEDREFGCASLFVLRDSAR
jgi:hypothetical protein